MCRVMCDLVCVLVWWARVQWTAVLWRCLFPVNLTLCKGTLAGRPTGREEHWRRKRAMWDSSEVGGRVLATWHHVIRDWWENHIGAVKTKDGKSSKCARAAEHDGSHSTH